MEQFSQAGLFDSCTTHGLAAPCYLNCGLKSPFLNAWSPEGGAIGEGCGTRRRGSLSEGSLGMDPETTAGSTSCSLCLLLQLPCSPACCHVFSTRVINIALEPYTKITPSSTRYFCQGVFLQNQTSNWHWYSPEEAGLRYIPTIKK